jgi:hypothetical protein
MAERVYGDAAVPEVDRLAARLARWIMEKQPKIINGKQIRRTARLPGLRDADKVKIAIEVLTEADWLVPAPARSGSSPGRQRDDYAVNPRLRNVANGD